MMLPIVFIHIPKTGGLTIYSVFRDIYKPAELYKLHPEKESLEKLTLLPGRVKNRIRLFYGHTDFDVSKLMPPGARYVTILREPLDRAISHYHYYRTFETKADDKYSRLAQSVIFNEWINEQRIKEMDNGQTRRLSGVMDDVEFGCCDSEMLAMAKSNLKKCEIVGLTEHYDETYVMMCKLFGWKIKFYAPRNMTRKRLKIEEVDTGLKDNINRYNTLDTELYAYAKDLFEDKLRDLDISKDMKALMERKNSHHMRTTDLLVQNLKGKYKKYSRKIARIRYDLG